MTKREIDLDEVVEFYCPYPRDMERIKVLPRGVGEVLDYLNGRKIAIKEALKKIKESAPENPKNIIAVIVSKHETKSFILLNIKDSAGIVHSWRLIKFKPVKEEGE